MCKPKRGQVIEALWLQIFLVEIALNNYNFEKTLLSPVP